MHATDANRAPMDLYREIRNVNNPLRSKRLVICLRVARSPGRDILARCAESIRLMDARALPKNEPQWTCRVWAKQFLLSLSNARCIQLPTGIGMCLSGLISSSICTKRADRLHRAVLPIPSR